VADKLGGADSTAGTALLTSDPGLASGRVIVITAPATTIAIGGGGKMIGVSVDGIHDVSPVMQ